MRVCVIGAGFAGLAAADNLARARVDVILVEARDRVGGRVWSDRIANGGLIERGAEFITAGYLATERYAARLGIALDGMGIRYPDRTLRPDPGLDRAAVHAAAAQVERAATREPHRPAADLLAEVVADGAIRELFASRIQSAHAYPVDDLRAATLAGVSRYLATEETRRLRGGNMALADRLASGLPHPVRLREPVRAIRLDSPGVTVSTASGQIGADACIVAVPLPLIASIHFEPALPSELVDAIARVPMGVAAKLAAPLLEPAPADAVMSVPHRFWAYTTPCDEVGGRVVGSWAGSLPVVASLAAERGPALWKERISELWPELRLDTADPTITTWHDDPWAKGVYSVIPHVAAVERPLLARPVGRVAFAGEHTEDAWSATMEGALRSGERAAADVLAMLR